MKVGAGGNYWPEGCFNAPDGVEIPKPWNKADTVQMKYTYLSLTLLRSSALFYPVNITFTHQDRSGNRAINGFLHGIESQKTLTCWLITFEFGPWIKKKKPRSISLRDFELIT